MNRQKSSLHMRNHRETVHELHFGTFRFSEVMVEKYNNTIHGLLNRARTRRVGTVCKMTEKEETQRRESAVPKSGLRAAVHPGKRST